jgi:hypothetical protein
MIRKPGKSDYTIPGAYRPIAEEEGMGKVIESVLTNWLSGFAETEGLLSLNQFGGRPGRSAVDALLLLTQKIKDAWRVGKVASVLLMDISQVFPSISHAHLIHLLHVKRVPEAVVGIISSFLSNQQTTLTFDDFHSPLAPIPIPNGLSQGSPLSALLFLIFANELLHDRDNGGYIDDISRFTASYSLEDNVEDLEEHMERKACPTALDLGLTYLNSNSSTSFPPVAMPSTTALSLSHSPVSQSSLQPPPNSLGSSLTTSSRSESMLS